MVRIVRHTRVKVLSLGYIPQPVDKSHTKKMFTCNWNPYTQHNIDPYCTGGRIYNNIPVVWGCYDYETSQLTEF